MRLSACLIVLCCILGVTLAGAPPPFTLLSPQDGTHCKIGSRLNISWNVVPGLDSPVYISLWGYNQSGQYIHYGAIGERSYKSGYYLWQVGDCPGRQVKPGNYFIRIIFWHAGVRLVAGNKNPIFITSNLIR